MNIGGGEAADQLVRMMLSGSEVAVRLSGSAIKNVLALTMALAKKHKTISGKVNLAKMLKEKKMNTSAMEKSIHPFRHIRLAASARPTLPHLSASAI